MMKLKRQIIGVLTLILLLGVFPAGAGAFLFGNKKELSGGELWDQNCERCHNYRTIADRTDREWKILMMHMRTRGQLTKEEAQKVLDYMQKNN